MRSRLEQFVAGAALLATLSFTSAASSTDFTDLWYVPQESGWGVNVVQSDAFLFVTFFIYGADNRPTWYTAQLTWDGAQYSGGLYATQGTFWAMPWRAENHPAAQQVGIAAFVPGMLNAYQATLTYTFNGTGTVSKQVVREALTPIAIGGSYLGAQAGAYSNCSTISANGSYADKYSLNLAQSSSGSATFTFTYDSGATCALSGTLQHYGQLYDVPVASYSCTGSLAFSTTATLYEIKATAQGVEGRLSANVPGGCLENASFSAVLLPGG